MIRGEKDLPKEFSHHRKGEPCPLRRLDSFQFYTKDKNDKNVNIPLEAISSARSTVYGKGKVLPWSQKDQLSTSSSSKGITVEFEVIEWALEITETPAVPSTLWVLSPIAWYQLLNPAPDYASHHYDLSLKFHITVTIYRALLANPKHTMTSILKEFTSRSSKFAVEEKDIWTHAPFVIKHISDDHRIKKTEFMSLLRNPPPHSSSTFPSKSSSKSTGESNVPPSVNGAVFNQLKKSKSHANSNQNTSPALQKSEKSSDSVVNSKHAVTLAAVMPAAEKQSELKVSTQEDESVVRKNNNIDSESDTEDNEEHSKSNTSGLKRKLSTQSLEESSVVPSQRRKVSNPFTSSRKIDALELAARMPRELLDDNGQLQCCCCPVTFPRLDVNTFVTHLQKHRNTLLSNLFERERMILRMQSFLNQIRVRYVIETILASPDLSTLSSSPSVNTSNFNVLSPNANANASVHLSNLPSYGNNFSHFIRKDKTKFFDNLHVNRTVQTFESIDKKSPPQIVRNAPVDEWADKFGTDWILTVGKTLPQTKAPEVENNNTPLIEEVIEVDSDGENLHPSPTLNPEKRHLPSNNNTNSSSARDITNDCKVAEKSTHFAKFHGGENHHPNNTNTYPKSIEDTSHKISDSNNEFGSNETVNKID
jgi:hypothetical protein